MPGGEGLVPSWVVLSQGLYKQRWPRNMFAGVSTHAARLAEAHLQLRAAGLRYMATAEGVKQVLKDRLQAAEVEVIDTSGG